ncbi:TonB-dependent Receptor Plug Domain protein [Mariniflexile rhizosphaerae]|uniref:SusC/RagA family TonB-linked outer membrane protein n=1 Tax=unclassified Mariniflexile TaxID=2643887 RepID=UPI000CAD925B|nr:TonB-dependent receptor [Mariniflexile sp. TRM1-10]AXP82781.1 TonB-dependent Receptor Plug Domain protein [Mariniflexile sp. TRM1-10]PLB19036.1 MAG: putative outer membrane protein involved in nutrient binding [Flavobacteriaceae bacterium FS1-H7996/R]
MKETYFAKVKLRMGSLIGIFMLCSMFSNLYALPDDISRDVDVTLTKVTGKITSAVDGQPLPGATVMVKGTTKGVVSNFDGDYEIEVNDPANAVLKISFIGFKTIEIPVNNQSVINIALEEDNALLEEVVIVGYGQQKKATLTGAVEQVKAEVFEDRAVTNPALALQGETPGLVITRGSSRPGREGINMQIRGATSVNYKDNNGNLLPGAGPLIVIDGSPVIDDEAFYSLNPDDIESISVLKDGAASIYGSRASNGVILVTTKRGTSGKMTVNFTSNLRFNTIGIRPPTPTMQQYATVWLDGTDQDGVNAGYWGWRNRETLERMQSGEEGIYTTQYWGDIFIGNYPRFDDMYDTSVSNQQNLSLSGGTEKSKYRLSVGYSESVGNLQTAYDGKKQYNVRLNNDFTLSDKVKLETGISYFRSRLSSPSGGLGVTSISNDPPFFPAKNPFGQWYANFGVAGNRNSVANTIEGGRDESYADQLKMNIALSYDITNDLNFRATGSVDKEFWDQEVYKIRVPQYTWFGNLAPESVNSTSSFEKKKGNVTYQTYGAFLNYNKTLWNDHNFSVMAGTTAELRTTDDLRGYRQGFEDNGVYDLDVALLDQKVENSGGSSNWGLLSYVARFNYNYKNKYLLELTGRRDGSSKFHEDYRWSNFGGISAGWVLTEEPFLQNIDGLDFLKVRASYGEMGGQVGIKNHDYTSSMSLGTAVFGTTASNQTTAYVNGLTSLTRTWERIGMANYGWEIKMLDSKLSLTWDYFTKKNDGMLISVEYPQVLGGKAPKTNDGVLKVYGWEAVLSYKDQIGDFKYNVAFNIGDTKNRVTSMGGFSAYNAGLNGIVEGYPINSFFMYQTDGFFANEAEVQAYYDAYGNGGEIPDASNAAVRLRPGDTRKLDLDGDGKILGIGNNDEGNGDVKFMGDATPHYTFGLNLGFQYKNFDLSTLFQGALKQNVVRTGYLAYPFSTVWSNQTSEFLGRTWTEENPNAEYPRMSAHPGKAAWNWKNNDFMMLNNKYVRMKTLIVGYTLRDFKLGNMNFDKFRFYFSGNDLFEITKIKNGFDPEFGESTNSSYPFNRTYSLGLNVTF